MEFRWACAIESAALANMNRDVFVIFVAPVGYPQNKTELSPVLRALSSYPNIYLRNVHLPSIVTKTPVEKWCVQLKKI